MTIKAFGILAGAMLLAGAQPALAATLIPAVFDFTTGSNHNISDGNARFFSATSPTLGTFNVRATAWSLETVNGNTYVRDSKLMVYDGGLGVISNDDGNGDQNRHTIDNNVRKDFILLQFDKHVRFISATFNTYSVRGATRDSDATFKYGVMDGGLEWNDSLQFLNNQNVSSLNALFDGGFTSLGGSASNTRDINPGRYAGDIWLVGADFINSDRKTDGFKFTNLAVVPEPGTWAMMIAGFGLVGAAMRRRGSKNNLIAGRI